ncbi:MAG: DUF4079 domain-containing protein [Symploca sp. SIO3C6]|uniref:DUF4079 domain-containing protein n=1 Tax=Symploca sp. SIO1C4 TaxID=2607765 RepID=A0A6B3N869_9CYAN|nr:DUF4079 domain-containing protein [Symploca sp. SIO3C6]NER27790.1 DUF4079 domain-containing protein [Symploca sp. SIO1C4]NET05766.1 DUF4079 domain-containing protein [Symploca sp. SIO2B6]
METADFIALIHPAIAVTVVFPIIGMVVNFAWQTRQRRLQNLGGGKSKIPPVVGREHVKLGKWLSGSVVGITIIALAYSVVFGSGGFIDQQKKSELQSTQVVLIALMFAVTIAAFVLLYRARPPLWRGIFATLTGIGLVVLGAQDGVYRRTFEWYWSHYYMGIGAALLMVFSLAIIEDIYKDRSNRWRNVHIILNCLALLLFLGQGMTGARDLLEIPLSWQKSVIYQCDFENLTC